MSPFWKFSLAGFAATAITYGPARMGFGLFLPQFRTEFALTSTAAGILSGLGFLGFFAGLVIAQAMTSRHGPRRAILCGLIAATTGLATVALSTNTATLAIGVFLALSSAGFSWAPFNNAVHRQIRDPYRPEALSAISTGTALGVALAGLLALAMALSGISWRFCWGLFAGLSFLALLGNIFALRDVAGSPGRSHPPDWSALKRRAAGPLFAVALSHGVTSAIFISFAADRISQAGTLPGLPEGLAPALVFTCYGLMGLAGLFTDHVKARTGLAWLVRLLLWATALSLALVALAPSNWAGVLLASGLQGVNVMMMSAVLAFWSDHLFPSQPSFSFTAVLLAMAAGSVIGPSLAGAMSDTLGPATMFLAAALVPAALSMATGPGRIVERVK
jgi:MFS family permease